MACCAHQTVHHPHIAVVQGEVAGDSMLVALQPGQQHAGLCLAQMSEPSAVWQGMFTCAIA